MACCNSSSSLLSKPVTAKAARAFCCVCTPQPFRIPDRLLHRKKQEIPSGPFLRADFIKTGPILDADLHRSATEDITNKIEKIQSDTTKAVQSLKFITEIIHRLNEIANSTASSVEEQSIACAEMAKAIAESNSGAGQIADSMKLVLNQVTELTDGVEQNSLAADDLTELSEKLAELINS